ncbi:MAG: DUF4270 domain-containing protein [Paludibacteraceae bacterium]|nr:DUF4270 domain-containing protein [Paludibacteraceae bacterium]
MRNNWVVGIVVLTCLSLFSSCNGDTHSAGESILSEEDRIKVKSDTFGVVSALDSCMAIALTPDSFLLGECETHFGTIKADILTQLACPEGFTYPDQVALAPGDTLQIDPIVDSVCLYLYYNTWYGDGSSPLGINVYEMDRQTLLENERYPSNLQIGDYCSLDESTRITNYSTIVVPQTPADSSYSSETEQYIPTIRIKLSNKFAKRFFEVKDFSTQQAFNQQFKGLYICTDFGGSNVLYISDIAMTVFYHFTMPRPSATDSVIYDTKSFYVNEEVRQVNRYVYPNRPEILEKYSQVTDTNYIVSPANIYTQLSVRMDSIFNRIDEQLGNDSTLYSVYVNKANLTVDVLYSDSVTDRPRDNWDSPATYMMLIKESSLEDFFSQNTMPSDSVAIVGTLSASTDTLGNTTYNYTYDLSTFLTLQLHEKNKVDELKFVLIPISVTTNSSTGSITSIRQLQTISATRIRSANNSINPMDIEMVYCSFNRTH